MHYKAHLVAKGYSQIPGQDYMETTSPVAHLVSYHAILSLAAKLDLKAHHLNIKTTFLNGSLEEKIYMKALDGFTGRSGVWKLLKSLYRLKQALYIWNKLLDSTLKKLGFDQCDKDACVYMCKSGEIFTILAVHVDNMLVVSNSKPKLVEVKLGLAQYFKVKDLGEVKFLLGIEVLCDRQAGRLELSQHTYIEQLLKCFNLQDVKPATTPLSSGICLTQDNCLTTNEEKKDMANNCMQVS